MVAAQTFELASSTRLSVMIHTHEHGAPLAPVLSPRRPVVGRVT